MLMRRIILSLFLLLACISFCNAQSKEVQSLLDYITSMNKTSFLDCDSTIKFSRLNGVAFLKEDTTKVIVLQILLQCLRFGGVKYSDTTRKYADQLVALSNKLNFRRSLSYSDAGYVVPHTSEAVKNYLIAQKIAEETMDSSALATADSHLSYEYIDSKNYPAAVEVLLKILKMSKYPSTVLSTETRLGIIYSYQKRYEDALKTMNKVIIEAYEKLAEIKSLTQKRTAKQNLADSLNYFGSIAANKINMAEIYLDRQDFQEALKYYLDVANDPIIRSFANHNGIGEYPRVSLFYIARLYLKHIEYEVVQNLQNSKGFVNELDSARKYQELGVNTFHHQFPLSKDTTSQPYKILKEWENTFWAPYYYAKGLISSGKTATAFFDSSLQYYWEVIRTETTKGQLLERYESISKVYAGKNDYKNALKYTNLSHAIKDSILNNETNRKIEQLRIESEVQTAHASEKTKHEAIQNNMKLEFAKKEDSLRFVQTLIQEQLKQQTLLSIQRQQHLELQKASLDLSNKQKQIIQLNFLKSQSDLLAEQSQRQDKEKELTIIDRENALNISQLQLQKAQLLIKGNQLLAERRQRYFYIGGIILLLLFLFFIIRDFKNRQKANAAIASEKIKRQKTEAIHKMAELELQSLRAQLNPHFMFNSLNAIQELVLMEDYERSHIYLSAFADLLRTLLDNANQPFIPLTKEIEFLELYLSLENLRIPNLQYSIHAEEGVLAKKINIPNMILQPYIENAIWHGLSHKKDNRKLDIRINHRPKEIIIQIEDNGVGRKKADELKSLYRKQHTSKGMELLSKRFSLLSKEYATEIQTTIKDLTNGEDATGTLVEIVIPLSLTEKTKELYDTYHYN